MGETPVPNAQQRGHAAFSILERIDVGETLREADLSFSVLFLSVSSNGSTWVKPALLPNTGVDETSFSILERIDVGETRNPLRSHLPRPRFQYPRTDRRG